MLISAVLTLQPTAPATLPAYLGRATHAWLLDQVRSLDPALAASLHQPNQERPFTVSNLWGAGRLPTFGKVGNLPASMALAPDRPCYLRLTSYEPALSALLADKLLPELPPTISLAGATLRVLGATTDPAQHPWAGQTTTQELLLAHTLHGEPPAGLTMHFASPTVFRSQELLLPLPLPKLVFEGLARRWNATAAVALPPEVVRFAEECLAISRHRLRTERVTFGEQGEHGVFPGFLGHVGYAFRVKDRYWMGLIHLLAAFSLYAGVGQRTAMGMGQARKG
jgi:CRISPR-associated endoribonuclease Cas6